MIRLEGPNIKTIITVRQITYNSPVYACNSHEKHGFVELNFKSRLDKQERVL